MLVNYTYIVIYTIQIYLTSFEFKYINAPGLMCILKILSICQFFFFWSLFIYSLIYLNWEEFSLSQSLSTPPPLYSQFTPPLFPFRKRQISQGYQPDMAYQLALRLGTSLYVNIKRGNLIWENWSPKQAKAEISPTCTHCQEIQRKPSYTTVTCLKRLSPLQAPWLSVQSLWIPMSPS